jgi:hypothetical protein
MSSKITILLLVSAFAFTTTAALAGARHSKRHNYAARIDDGDMSVRKWQLNRLYRQRDGYLPDYRGCFPGVCRDNPYY